MAHGGSSMFEYLRGSDEHLSPGAIEARTRHELKNSRPGYGPEELELHHRKPKRNGGEYTKDNLDALGRPEHAIEHRRTAIAREDEGDLDQARADRWAVEQIIRRMTPNERRVYAALVVADEIIEKIGRGEVMPAEDMNGDPV